MYLLIIIIYFNIKLENITKELKIFSMQKLIVLNLQCKNSIFNLAINI